MSLPRHLLANGTLARPLRGDAEPWDFAGAALAPRPQFDPFARRAPTRRHPLKITAAGWRILLHVLRLR